MRLRNQLLALSLLTLLLPWSGWKLVQELENFLRQAEEKALTGIRTDAKQGFAAGISGRAQTCPWPGPAITSIDQGAHCGRLFNGLAGGRPESFV